MKQKIRLIDMTGKKPRVIENEVEIRDRSHLDAQIRFPHLIQTPKKGKGSFKRRSKYKNTYLNDKY